MPHDPESDAIPSATPVPETTPAPVEPSEGWPEVAEAVPESPAPVEPPVAASAEEVAFDVPPPTGDPGSFTMGIEFAQLAEDLAEQVGLPPTNDPPSGIPPIPVEALTPLAEAPVVAEDDLVPLADAAPTADPASSTTLAAQLEPPSGISLTADSSTRLAELVEPLPPVAAAVTGESGVLDNLEPVAPVQPASGWFDHHAEDDGSLPTAEPASALGSAPVPTVESSDIFATGPTPQALSVDPAEVSDVIAATAGPPLASLGAPPSRRPEDAPGRSSDVAIAFDAPPGGSTIADPTANAGLPVAEDADEAVLAAEAINESPLDSAELARTPELPDRRDEADLGASPPLLPDASSILAELSGDPHTYYEDSSAVRLEAPGIERTLSDDSIGEAGFSADLDLTEADIPLPNTAPEKGGVVRGDSVSDVDLGRVETGRAFEDELSAVQSTGQSSIFSDLKDPGLAPTGGSGDVPIADPDLADAVDFSDHPDPSGADSGSFHRGVMPPAAADPGLAALAEADEDGMIDWNAAEGHPEATMGLGAAGIPASLFSGPASGILSRGRGQELSTEDFDAALADDSSAESAPTRPARAVPAAKGPPPAKSSASDSSDPSVVVEWMSDSSAEKPLAADTARPSRKRDRDRDAVTSDDRSDPRRPAAALAAPKRGISRVLGPLFGLVVGVGASAGVFYSGVLGDGKPAASGQPAPNVSDSRGSPDGSTPRALASDLALVRSNPVAAIRDLEAAGAATPEAKAHLGEARLLAALRQSGPGGSPVSAEDLKQARADLEAAISEADTTPAGEQAAARATLKLALSYEVAGDTATARKLYTEGLAKFPAAKATFEAALDRLDATALPTSKSSRLTPAEAEQLVLASNFLTMSSPPSSPPEAALPEPPEAGPAFWKAVNAAAKGDYDTAIQKIDEAKKTHLARAKALAGQGLNPASDPLEQIFPRCCDDLKASWEFRRTTYPKLLAAEKAAEADRLAAAEARKNLKIAEDRADKLAADLKTEKANATKLADELKKEQEAVVKLKDDLKKSDEAVTDLTGKLKKSDEAVTDLTGKLKKSDEAVTDLTGKLKKSDEAVTDLTGKLKKASDDTATLTAKLKDADAALLAAEKARTDAQSTLDTIAKELQAAKVLPAKYDTPALISAVRGAAKVAANPEVAGAVERAVKAEAEAKTARDELAKATAKAEADLKKLKDDQAAAEKKLRDAQALELKTLKETQAADLKKRDDLAAAEMKKLADEHAAATKKLKDAHALELKKQADDHQKALAVLQAQVADEKARIAALTKKFETDLGNAISPGQALDQWLTILMGLRRPADADPALAAAAKVLASAPPGSEDHAKAQTVSGLALLIKGDAGEAKIHLIQAKSSPAYQEAAAAKKPWALAADVGLASVDDPVAPLRRPVAGPSKDPRLAAKYFDAGVTAYRGGRFAEAEKALAQAAWHDESNPLTWYFLGAARWQLGKADQARADFQQGAEREKNRTIPTRSIEAAISPIQGAARDALTDARR